MMKELPTHNQDIRRTVLIVDDGLMEREILGAMLRDLYEIIYTENGETAHRMIQSGEHPISLVMLDLHMPESDGYGFLKLLRSEKKFRHIPVIVLTSEKGAEVECLKLGAADFIAKPYDAPEVVRARVAHAIQLNEDRMIIRRTERDELTGLYSKEFFFEYGKRLDKYNHIPMDAVIIDVNRFRIMCDLYGRAYGEEILRTIAGEIHKHLRGTYGIACRSGSNSFYIYAPHIENMEQRMSEYIDLFRQTMDDGKISMRIGIYADDGSEPDMELKFDRARFACQNCANSYETQYSFYDASIHEKQLFSELLKNDIGTALREKQFKVLYQPQYDVQGEAPTLSGMEALVRWMHPEHGIISPNVFIPLFEDNGMIYQLDRYVWNEVAEQMSAWQKKYGVSIPVSVNVSRVDLFEPRLKEELSEILKRNGLSNDKLVLEITESAYTDNQNQIVDTIKEFREEGFQIEMDDFGAGYSSLNMLSFMPMDAIKLDREFVNHTTGSDDKAKRMIGIVADIANLMEVPMIVEGIETGEQMELVKSFGCHILQGYYFSKPLPPEELEAVVFTEKEGK